MVLESCALQNFWGCNKEGISNHRWLGGGYSA